MQKAKPKSDLKRSPKESSPNPFLVQREADFPLDTKILKTQRVFSTMKTTDVFKDCDLTQWDPAETQTQENNYEIISQPRAVRAISVGLGVRKPGYNIYVAGVQGTGKTSVIRSFLKKTAQTQPTPSDLIYVYNFKNSESPRSISLPTGTAKKLKKEMDELIELLTVEIPDALQSEEYENNVNQTVNASNEKKAKLFNELEKTAKQMSFGVKSTRMGIVTVPIIDGKPLSEKEYGELSDEQKEKIEQERNVLEPEVLDFARKVRAIESDTKEKLDGLRSQVGDFVVGQALEPLLSEYSHGAAITEYLGEVRKHILENLDDFLPNSEEGAEEDEVVAISHAKKGDPFLPYRINVFVDNTDSQGAPIVIENNPTFYNLFGKIEKNIEYGIYTTDFKMIKAGSLAKANGGYLVINVVDVLRTPNAWETLKRTLRNQKLYIEDLGEQYSILPTSGLRPEPIPLEVKIILIGSDWIYRVLYQHDDDFHKIFKIKADFDLTMDRTDRNISDYMSFVNTRSKVENLLPFESGAVAAIVEHSSRIVDDQQKLTTRFSLIKDITIEADFVARENKREKVTRQDVERAIEERYIRSSLVENHLVEMIQRGDILISTRTRRQGEINGLGVYSLGDVQFGLPMRITCRTYRGKPGIINVERDASLSGRIHNKGISILTSWIYATFGRKNPVVLAATVCFEQNYSGVDGDSATLAELILILASLADLPLDQSIAVTGSVNQFGEIQPVGGVNEKIEGFFRICRIQGFNGRQGCMIPHQNVKNLMLHQDVRDAMARGEFHVWPVSRVEEAFELMTGCVSGEWEEKQKQFTKGSAFQKILQVLSVSNKKEESEKPSKSRPTSKKRLTKKKG